MSDLDFLTAKLQENAHTYAHDLAAVDGFISELTPLFEASDNDVFIKLAVVELTNASGYRVGHLIWDADHEAFTFVAAAAIFEQED